MPAAVRCGDEIGVAMRAVFGGGGDFVAAGFAVADELLFGVAEDGGDGGEEGAGPEDDHVNEEACDAGEEGDEGEEEAGGRGAGVVNGAVEAVGGVHER